jgi:P-type Mg2+ transporter
MAKNNQEFRYPYWSLHTTALLQESCTNHTTKEQKDTQEYEESGLSSEEANPRLSKYRKNLAKSTKNADLLSLLISQFKSPIIVIFIFTSVLSFFLGQTVDS